MAEPNNGVVVGPVRLVVTEGGPARGNGTLWDAALDLVLAALLEQRNPAELRVYALESGDLLATRRFRSRASAHRGRTKLVDLATGAGADTVDWVGEVARLADGATP